MKRYLKKWNIEKTNIVDPIQGQVQDPEDLWHFIKDIQNEVVQKTIVLLLDEKNISLGNHIVGMAQKPTDISKKLLFTPIIVFHAPRFMVITNHPSGDAAPEDEDKEFIHSIMAQTKSFIESEMVDYIIVGNDSYWAMTLQHGTGCHCGHQKEIEGDC